MQPTIAQFQHYLRNLSRMHGQGFWIQKALFEAMGKDPLFDNLKIGGAYDQQTELTDMQFETLKNIKQPLIIRAREMMGNYEQGRAMDRSFYGITEEEQKQDDIREVQRRMIDINNKLGGL